MPKAGYPNESPTAEANSVALEVLPHQGCDWIKAFECLLKEDKNLRIIKVTNCGLGPEGGEMIADALM